MFPTDTNTAGKQIEITLMPSCNRRAASKGNKRLELVDGFTDVAVKDVHHRKACQTGEFIAEVKGVGRISQISSAII